MIHRRIAETVRDQLPEWANAQPEIVAHHFTQGGLPALAVEWWGKAGELAMQRSAFAEAVAHLERALQLTNGLGEGPDQRRSRLRLQTSYGYALRMARGFGDSETLAAFAVAHELAAAVDDVSERFPAYFGLWSGSFVRGNPTSMQEVAAAFLRDVKSMPMSPDAAMAHRICGISHWYEGNFIAARRFMEQALTIADGAQRRKNVFSFNLDVTSIVMVSLPLALWPLGILDRAGSLTEEAVAHALETKHIPTIVLVYDWAAHFEMMRRDRSRAAANVQALLGLAREHAISDFIASGTFGDGWLRSGAVNPAAGIADMHKGIALLGALQQELFMPLYITLLAEVEAEAGRISVALATLDTQLTSIERTGHRWFLAELHRTRGEILLKRRLRDVDAAESAFKRAIDVARSQAAKLFELQAVMSLARLWQSQGKRQDAYKLLAPVHDWFTEGFDTKDLQEAKSLLAELR